MSWAQQREAIRIAAEAGVRARTSAAGSETLPLTHHHLRYAMLSRPNGELTRAGQYYYQLIDRPPPSRQYDRNQPLIREGPNDYIMLRGGAKKLLRSLQPNGNYHLTKLGKSFFKDKWVDWVVHVPVIIRGIRRNGRNRDMPYERTKRLPVTDLNVTLPRQSEGLSDAQAARNLKASALAQLGNPEPNDIIWELSDESYYLDATREWTFSQQAMQVVDDRVVVETVLDQPLGALRDVSYQLYCGDEIEQRPDKLCVPRQLAELMRLPLQEVLSDFDAICTKKTWREGITPREIREFCLWRQAAMFYVDCQGRLLDKYEPTVKEQRAVAFTSWNGHAFFYKSAPYRGERKPGETPEFKDWREWEGEVASGLFYTEDLEQVRRELLAEGHCRRVRGGEDCVISAFHEDLDVLQAWMAYMLDKGLATWRDFVHSLDATAHVDQESVAQALQKMEAAWPEGEEHYAKLSVNALIGLCLIYTMRTSNHQFDGSGCQHRELFLDAAGGMHWDHIYVTQLLSNRSCRPVHDFVMASEYVAVSRIRDALATVPSRYLKAVKTDCVVFQDLPKKFQGLVDGLVRERHPDGTPVYRCEEVKGLEGQYRIPRIEAECMCNIDTWKVAEDPVLHCLEGGSLLLTGYPGTGKTHLARQIVTALREEGYKVKIITKTHSSVQNFGMQAETADHWVRSTVRNGYCNIDWLVAEEITQLDTGLWNDVACVSMNRKRELKHSQLLHDLTDGWHHELTENMRSDPGIFDFLRWLRVDEPWEHLVISHAHRITINARDNRRLAAPEAVTIEYTGTGPTTTNMPQTMRVWPGLKLIGVGGRVTKGIYMRVAEVGPEKIVLDGGDSFTHAALLKHTRLRHAITYASAGLPTRHREPARHPQAPLCGS
ncbi:unnamed protein product [Symbiodinium natans]|uniref:AAA+ ATPase domain-containing protein n=1 Tax=Symbiodinium natans TaxID=878477 RepID=A0A812SGW6_9DINO|nr:unnamed protein product [Symbiodinium natans]